MTFDYPDLIAAAFLCAVAVGFGYPLGRYLWRRTLLVDRRWATWREKRRLMREAMMVVAKNDEGHVREERRA